MNEIFSQIRDGLNGATGIVVALVAFVTALATALGVHTPDGRQKIMDWCRRVTRPTEPTLKKKSRSQPLLAGVFAVIGIVLVVIAILPQREDGPRPWLLTQAWKAYNQKKWDQAHKWTNILISKYEMPADKQHMELKSNSEPPPKLGRVSSTDAQFNHGRGLVNDVATAYFIRGEANLNLNRPEDARADWQKAIGYSYAVTYDVEMDEFWLTKDGAENKLYQLNKSSAKAIRTPQSIIAEPSK